MHHSTQPPERVDAWLALRVGRNAPLRRLTELIDWALLEAWIERVRRPLEHVFGTLNRS